MGVMIHLGFKTADGGGPPSPVDGPHITTWPLDEWASQLSELAGYGLTVPVLPPLPKGATLGAGDDPFDHYDLGNKMQSGRRETRYGSVEQLMRFVAVAHAAGMQAYANVVHHHVDGDDGDYVFTYYGADGKTRNGRFPKDIHCFWVWSAKQPNNPDAVADPDWDLQYGREFEWDLGTYDDGKGTNGPGYVREGLAAALAWQTARADLDGYFFDDVKGTNPTYIGYVTRQPGMAGKVSFGEYSDGTTSTLMWWMHETPVNGACGVLDFALRYKIRDVLNTGADMRVILQEGVCWQDPAHAITFIEDSDLDLSDPIISSKLLGYAMLATFPGYPMLFGKDLYQYGLLPPCLTLIWFHETFAKGEHWWRATAAQYLIYERMGDDTSSGCIVGVCMRSGAYANPADWTPVTVPTKWRNTRLHDYSGHSNDVWTDANGYVTLWLPPNENANGKSYVLFAVAGVDNPIHLPAKSTTQVIEGAIDLDVMPATDGVLALDPIWVGADKPIHIGLTIERAGWTATSQVMVAVTGPNGVTLGQNTLGMTGSGANLLDLVATMRGYHTISITGADLPADGVNFKLTVTYTGTPTLAAADFE